MIWNSLYTAGNPVPIPVWDSNPGARRIWGTAGLPLSSIVGSNSKMDEIGLLVSMLKRAMLPVVVRQEGIQDLAIRGKREVPTIGTGIPMECAGKFWITLCPEPDYFADMANGITWNPKSVNESLVSRGRDAHLRFKSASRKQEQTSCTKRLRPRPQRCVSELLRMAIRGSLMGSQDNLAKVISSSRILASETWGRGRYAIDCYIDFRKANRFVIAVFGWTVSDSLYWGTDGAQRSTLVVKN
jgi:hypothetical protein